MKRIIFAGIICSLFGWMTAQAAENCPRALDFTVKELAGDKSVNLCDAYLGKVVLVVNTASKCGFTPQYDGLESLYRRYRDKGFVVLGFPSNDFGEQEPGKEDQIKEFCRLTYGVEFPMFEKTRVRAYHADPLYRTLGTLANEYPQWNFHKYLIDREGRLVRSFRSELEPENGVIENTIKQLL
jgi:glutathione peroxidase